MLFERPTTRKNHTTPAFVVSLDIGYSNVKRVDGYADAADPTQSIRPAQAAPLHSLNGNATLKEGEHYVQLECEPWAEFLSAGRADATRELHADYAASKAYRALFNASISEACGEGRNEIDHFITGLPVSQMRQPQLVERLTAQLTGTHQVVPKREIQVHKVSVLPQPVGTLNYIYSTYEAWMRASSWSLIRASFQSTGWCSVAGISFGTPVTRRWRP